MANLKRSFINMSIGKKVMFIPTITILAFVLIGFMFWQSQNTTFYSLERSSNAEQLLKKLEESGRNLLHSKAALLQSLSWKMGYVEEAKVMEQINLAKTLITDVGTVITDEKEAMLANGIALEDFDGFMLKNQNYLASLTSTAEMITIDAETAIITLNDTFDKYDQANDAIIAMINAADGATAAMVTALKDALSTSLYTVLGAIVAAVLLSLVIGAFISRAISLPIQQLTGVTKKLADGDLSVEIPDTQRGDEVGVLAKTVEVFKEGLLHSQTLQTQQNEQQEQELKRADDLNNIVKNFEVQVTEVVNLFSKTSEDMQAAAGSLGGSVETSERTASNVEHASNLAMGNVQTVAEAVQDMTSSIQEISTQVNNTQSVITSAVDKTEYANSETDKLVASAAQIGDIISLIQDIAEQTNLLALNATIESARAGEAGKGFAVVANEVKSLATQTGQATEKIALNIKEMQDISGSVTAAIQEIRGAIDEVNHYSSSVASAIEEQSSVTSGIANNMQSAASGVSEITENMTEVIRAVSEVRSVAETVSGTSTALAQHTGALR
jgi:methyl-accepting chemotaxis protein